MYRHAAAAWPRRRHFPGLLDAGAHPAGQLLRHGRPQPVHAEPRASLGSSASPDPRGGARTAHRTGHSDPRPRPSDVCGALRGRSRLGHPQRRRLGLADAGDNDLARSCLAGLRSLDAHSGDDLRDIPRYRVVVAVGWLLVAVAPLLVATSYARLHTAAADVRAGNCAAAKQSALSSISWEAVRPDAYSLIGVCDLEQGFAAAAVPAMAKAVSLDPQNWQEAYWLAVARGAAGQNPHTAALRALQLNPLEPLARRLVRALASNRSRSVEGRSARAAGSSHELRPLRRVRPVTNRPGLTAGARRQSDSAL